MRSRRGVALLVVLVVLLTACSSVQEAVPGPGRPDVASDTAELRAAKAQAGIEDCVPGSATGSALPSVTLACLGGGPDVDLASLQGPLVINFWQAACKPCRVEMPILGDFHRRYGDQVPVVGVDLLDTVPALALQLAGERRATYPQLADPGGELLEQPVFARARGLPYLAVVDADGVLQSQKLGGVESMDELVTIVDDALGTDLDGSGSSGGSGSAP